MKTWLVILYLGKSVGVFGPLASGMPGCIVLSHHRKQLESEIRQSGHSRETLDCVQANRKPALGERR